MIRKIKMDMITVIGLVILFENTRFLCFLEYVRHVAWPNKVSNNDDIYNT